MEYIDNIPIYLQIKDILYRKIISKEFILGSQLPSVRQLAVQFSANSNTVQKALKEMTEEGVIISQRGKGNFVTEDVEIVSKLKKHIVNEMFDATYDKLHSLDMNDSEIMKSFSEYVRQREASDE